MKSYLVVPNDARDSANFKVFAKDYEGAHKAALAYARRHGLPVGWFGIYEYKDGFRYFV